MSTALESIVAGVLEELELRKVSMSALNSQVEQAPAVLDAYAALARPGTQIIAEVKRASPSKGDLAQIANPVELAVKYEEAGAAVVSVLTEARRFKGSNQDLIQVRREVEIPLLRKDFIVTEYQVLETRALGADLMLLIVASLSDSQLNDFYQMATELGMSVLIEVHDENELERALSIGPKIIGVNSRNLKTLEIQSDAFARLIPMVPKEILGVAESGISTREEVAAAEAAGAKAILVGETLVKAGNPVAAISELLGR